MNFKNKKISLSLLLTSIVTIIFFSIIQEKKKVYSLNEYGISVFKRQRVVEFLEITFSFNNSLFFLFLIIIVSCLSLIFLNDEIIIKKIIDFKRRIFGIKDFKLPSSKNIWLIFTIVLIVVLILIGVNIKKKKSTSVDTIEEVMDTIPVIDSTAVSSSAKNNESIVPPNANLDYSEAALQAEAAETEIGKSLKGSTLEFEGDIAKQGLSTD